MALTLETGTALANSDGTSNWSASLTHSLQNASGNDRLVMLFVTSHSGQVGDIGIASVTYNSTAPDYTITLNQSGGGARELWYVAIWKDASLPSTSGSYTTAFTLSNHGSSPMTYYYVLEVTGADQTTVPAETEATNTGFTTTTQTYTATLGDEQFALISSVGALTGADPTASWGSGDTELADLSAAGDNQGNMAIAHTTDGTIAGTMSASVSKDGWIAFSITAAGGGTTDGANDINSSGTLTAEGESQVDVPVDINASASVTSEGRSQADSPVSMIASAAVTMDALEIHNADYSITSTGQIDWVGEASAITEAAVDINASGVLTAQGEASIDADHSITASATLTKEGVSNVDVSASLTGVAVATWVGETVAEGQGQSVISATAQIDMIGESTISSDVDVDFASELTVEGVSSYSVDIQIDSTAEATFSSEEPAPTELIPAPDGGVGGARPGWGYYRKKRKAKQEQEFFDLIQMAMPQILDYICRQSGCDTLH